MDKNEYLETHKNLQNLWIGKQIWKHDQNPVSLENINSET